MSSGGPVNTGKVFVELSVIPLNAGAHIADDFNGLFKGIDEGRLFQEPDSNNVCIEGEGEWEQVSALIHDCYQRVRAQSPHGYLRVAIR